jgi:hypothetical protein
LRVEKKSSFLLHLHKKYGDFWISEEVSENVKGKFLLQVKVPWNVNAKNTCKNAQKESEIP